jgi:hypothetical protein
LFVAIFASSSSTSVRQNGTFSPRARLFEHLVSEHSWNKLGRFIIPPPHLTSPNEVSDWHKWGVEFSLKSSLAKQHYISTITRTYFCIRQSFGSDFTLLIWNSFASWHNRTIWFQWMHIIEWISFISWDYQEGRFSSPLLRWNDDQNCHRFASHKNASHLFTALRHVKYLISTSPNLFDGISSDFSSIS